MKTCDSQLDEASILLIDGDGIILDARESACLSLGWAREELVNKRMSDVLEFGADMLKERLPELNDDSVETSSFSFLTLVRRQDQSSLPTTALVRRMPELGCFAVTFDDLPGDVREVSRMQVANLGQPETQSNADGPRFRNIFLAGSERPVMRIESTDLEPVDLRKETAALLESESQERQRLEGRVLVLTEQLQQLHAQLGKNLESENICQKKLCEREVELRNVEQSRVASEVALSEEKKKVETLEGNLARVEAAHLKSKAGQRVQQDEWLAKLEVSLTALRESDERLAAEVAMRREIQEALTALRQELATETPV